METDFVVEYQSVKKKERKEHGTPQYLLTDADGLHSPRVLQLKKHVLAVEPTALLVRVGLHTPDVSGGGGGRLGM